MLVGVVDGKKQDGDAHCDPEAGQQDVVVNELDRHADAHQDQKLANGADLLPPQLRGVNEAAGGDQKDIDAGEQIHAEIVGPADVAAGAVDPEKQSIPVIEQNDQGHQKRGDHAADRLPAGRGPV